MISNRCITFSDWAAVYFSTEKSLKYIAVQQMSNYDTDLMHLIDLMFFAKSGSKSQDEIYEKCIKKASSIFELVYVIKLALKTIYSDKLPGELHVKTVQRLLDFKGYKCLKFIAVNLKEYDNDIFLAIVDEIAITSTKFEEAAFAYFATNDECIKIAAWTAMEKLANCFEHHKVILNCLERFSGAWYEQFSVMVASAQTIRDYQIAFFRAWSSNWLQSNVLNIILAKAEKASDVNFVVNNLCCLKGGFKDLIIDRVADMLAQKRFIV